jgi:hypothetical protein
MRRPSTPAYGIDSPSTSILSILYATVDGVRTVGVDGR